MYSDFVRDNLEIRQNAPRNTIFTANALFLLAVAGLWATGLYSEELIVFLARVFPGMGASAMDLCVSTVYYLPFLLIPCALAVRRANAWESARFKPIGAGRMLSICLIAVLCALFAIQLLTLWTLLFEGLGISFPASETAIPDTAPGLTAMVVSMGVLPGVCEELLFRGVILNAYERRGTKKAIFISAIFFTLIHGSVAGLPTQLLIGLILGFLVFSSDSIYAGITFHTVYNVALLFLSVLASRIPVSEEEALALAEMSTFEYYGGWGGILSAVFYAALLGYVLFASLRALDLGRRGRGIALIPAPPETEKMSGGAKFMLVLGMVGVGLLYLGYIFMMEPLGLGG